MLGSVESWKLFCEIGGLIVLALTLIFAGGAWLASNILNKRQAAQIRDFNERLTKANTELGKQQERAAKAEAALAEVSNTAGAANQTAGEANERAALLEVEAATLHARAAAAELEVAKTKQDLAELLTAMLPRSMGTTFIHDEERALFEGTTVFIMYADNDSEAKGLAQQIANVLTRSKWSVLGVVAATADVMAPAPSHMGDGVNMLTYATINTQPSPFDTPAIRAAEIFNEHLLQNGILSNVEPPTAGGFWPSSVPIDALLIKIGQKPNRFWANKHMQLLTATFPSELQERLKEDPDSMRWDEESRRDSEQHRKEKRLRILEEQRRMRNNNSHPPTRPRF